jgi:aspartate aminotransferase
MGGAHIQETDRISDAGVTVLPGSVFYMPATRLSCRVTGVDFDGETVLNTWPGSEHVTPNDINTYLPKIELGCQAIKAFLESNG